MKRLRPLLLIALFSASACSGAGGVSSTVPQMSPSLPQAPQSAPQSQARTTLNERDGDKDKKDKDNDNNRKGDALKYAGQVTGCSPADPSCVGPFAIVLNRAGTSISGTWTRDFITPPPAQHDQGTFSGTMITPTTFTATFLSPQDSACVLTVSGTLTASTFNATYVFEPNRACRFIGTGTIVLQRVNGKKGDGDHSDRDDRDD